ncbi:hypothetical protein H4R33_005044 [Dimargaris cristalligena]|nr:hypothetical protein H4R33_005044 [Dimargaris cristalligena]
MPLVNCTRYVWGLARTSRLTTQRAFAKSRTVPYGRHSLWTARHSVHPELSLALRECLEALPKSPSSDYYQPWNALLLLVSASYGAEAIAALPALATTNFPPGATETTTNPAVLIGCVVDSVLAPSPSNASPTTPPTHPPNHRWASSTTIQWTPGVSLLAIQSSQPVVAFRLDDTTTQRRKLKSNAVGRWQPPDRYQQLRRENASIDMSRFTSVARADNLVQLPSELRALPSEEDRSPVFILFSDDEPHQFLDVLNSHFPASMKAGVIGSSTPFINGRPFTLFDRTGLYSSGMCGVAIPKFSSHLTSHVKYEQLVPVGDPLIITRCQGNVILELDGPGSEDLPGLLKRSTQAYESKQIRLYARIHDQNVQSSHYNDDDQSTVYRIVGGDPAKHTMVLDTVEELQPGQDIQIYHDAAGGDLKELPTGPVDPNVPSTTPSSPGLLQFRALDPDTSASVSHTPSMESACSTPALNTGGTAEPSMAPMLFGGASQNGFIWGHRARPIQIPNSQGTLYTKSD